MRRPLLGRALLWVWAAAVFCSSGCSFDVLHMFAGGPEFGAATFPVPVSPWLQQSVEDALWEKERYDRVPIMPPIEGQFAPAFCQDPPSDDEVMRAMPSVDGMMPFIFEKQRNNVRIVREPIGDWVDEPRFYPLVGPAQVHHCHYKVRVYYDGIYRSDWPIPFTHRDEEVEVIYMDHDHLHRVGSASAEY